MRVWREFRRGGTSSDAQSLSTLSIRSPLQFQVILLIHLFPCIASRCFSIPLTWSVDIWCECYLYKCGGGPRTCTTEGEGEPAWTILGWFGEARRTVWVVPGSCRRGGWNEDKNSITHTLKARGLLLCVRCWHFLERFGYPNPISLLH